MSTNVLAPKDSNSHIAMRADESGAKAPVAKDVKSMEYHRQVLKSKMEAEKDKKFVSPSDDIMSPCTAKLSKLRNKQVGKAKPKSLFAQQSAKKFEGENVLGARSAASQPSN